MLRLLGWIIIIGNLIVTSVCQDTSCPNGCSGHGFCYMETCFCHPSYDGQDCSLSNAGYHQWLVPEAHTSFLPRNQSKDFFQSKLVRQFKQLLDDIPKEHPEYPLKITPSHQLDGISEESSYFLGIRADSRKGLLRIGFVTCEFEGPTKHGGIGVANAALALALADAGHEVVVLDTWSGRSEEDSYNRWQEHYKARNVTLVPLLPSGAVRYTSTTFPLARHFEVYVWLVQQQFDLVYFHDFEGFAYYPVHAKSLRRGLHASLLIIVCHGASIWAKLGNGEALHHHNLHSSYLERESVRLADIIISPSKYMLDWMLNSYWSWPPSTPTYVQPNLINDQFLRLATALREGNAKSAAPTSINEVVFFGRLEVRKGVTVFCDALDILQMRAKMNSTVYNLVRHISVTFMGRSAIVYSQTGREYVEGRSDRWTVFGDIQLLTDLGHTQALDYLTESLGTRLAVMPAVCDNIPFTVMECALLGIPFISSSVGAVPEIFPDDASKSFLFDGDNPEALAARIEQVLWSGHLPSSPPLKVDPIVNRRIWQLWQTHIPPPPKKQPSVPQPAAPEVLRQMGWM